MFRGRHKNLKNGENFRGITQNKVIFSVQYWKTSIKQERIAKKLKMKACISEIADGVLQVFRNTLG
jgi:hypothetical protein